MLEKDEVIDSKLSLHDKDRFEFKLDLEFRKDEKAVYGIEYYFFVPQSLNISAETYTKEIFYSNTQHYIRFKTPNISLDKLFVPSNELSPYNKAMDCFERLNSGEKDDFIVETAVDEIKLMGSIMRAEIRDNADYIINNASKKIKDEMSGKIIEDLKMAFNSLSTMKTVIFSSNLNERIKESFSAFDEYISLIVEEYLTDIIKSDEASSFKIDGAVSSSVCKMILAQREYRKSMGYGCVIKGDKKDDHFLYRRGLLKKFISSALYLNPKLSDFNFLSHFGPGVAAGIAMFFAIIITIYAQTKYAINSVAFVLIIVISYIFKDRIKDWLKVVFSKKFSSIIYDRKISVTEPAHNAVIGHIKEAFNYLPVSIAPADVLMVRHSDSKKNFTEDAKFEKIFKYKREIFLDFSNIEKYHKRRKDLIDIIRFSVSDFLKHMDDNIVSYDYLDEKAGSVKACLCPRIYHVNLVIKYNISKNEFAYDRVRLMLNKSGIDSIEEVK